MTNLQQYPLPPLAPRLPILGNALEMMGDVQGFLVKYYRMLGSIYRIRALNQAFTVMAGAEANQFLLTQGEDYFSSEDTMGGLNREFQMRVHVLRGKPHKHLRGILGTGLSRDLLAARWDDFVAVTEARVKSWNDNKTLPVVDQFQRLAADQMSMVLAKRSSAEQFDKLRFAFELMLDVTLAKKWPGFALKLPPYQKARDEIYAFAKAALDERAAHPQEGAPDLLDRALNATDENGNLYPENVRVGMTLQGFFAGINTIAYLSSFMTYAMLRHPEVLKRVTAEVEQVYADGGLTFEKLRYMKAMHGLVMETLRMYPPAPASSRTAIKPFEFQGHRVDAGTHLLIAVAVPHHLAEFYPKPETFDINRDFSKPRQQGVYAPFSLGAHTCLGAGMTEVLATATMAMVVRNVHLQLPSPDYALKIQATPGPNPGKDFKVAVVGA